MVRLLATDPVAAAASLRDAPWTGGRKEDRGSRRYLSPERAWPLNRRTVANGHGWRGWRQ